MDPISAIVGALAAGALAATKETAARAIKDAYQGLKTIVIDVYKIASIPLLEKRPSDKAVKEAVERELRDTKGVESDVKVLEYVKKLQDALLAEPSQTLRAWGLTVKEIKAGKDVVLARISGAAGGAKVGKIRAAGNVRLTDIAGGAQGKK